MVYTSIVANLKTRTQTLSIIEEDATSEARSPLGYSDGPSMDVVLGFSGPFRQCFVEGLASGIASKTGSPAEIIECNDLASFATAVLSSRAAHKILVTERPDQLFADAIIASAANVYILYRGALAEAGYYKNSSNLDDLQIARNTREHAVCYAYIEQKRSSDKTTMRLNDRYISSDGLDLSDKDFRNSTKTIRPNHLKINGGQPTLSEYELEELFEPRIALSLKSVDNYFSKSPDSKTACTGDFFVIGPEANGLNSDVIDLTGREGLVLFGPYMPLTPGTWLVRLTIWASEPMIGQSLLFRFQTLLGGELDIIQTIEHEFSRSGRHDITLSVDIDSIDKLIEVVIFKTKAMFEGEIRVGYCMFERIESELTDLSMINQLELTS